MNDDRSTFNRGAVQPVECIRGGWQLVKDQYWLFMGISVVGALIAGMAPMGILVGPMMCGIYLCLLRREHGKSVKFEMLFRGFDNFVQSFIATLIMMIPVLVILIPAYIAFFAVMISQMPKQGQNAPPDPNALWTILGAYGVFLLVVFIVSIVVSVLFIFTYPLIVDRKLTGVQAVGTSFRAARANFGGLLGLVLLTTLITMVGLLACYVGAFFVMPIHFAALVVAYRQVFPRDDEPVPIDEDADEDDYPAST